MRTVSSRSYVRKTTLPRRLYGRQGFDPVAVLDRLGYRIVSDELARRMRCVVSSYGRFVAVTPGLSAAQLAEDLAWAARTAMAAERAQAVA